MVQSHLPPFRNLGNFVHLTFACVFQKRHRWPLLSGVYARGSKRPHSIMCNLYWTHKFSLDFKRPANGPTQYMGEKKGEKVSNLFLKRFLHFTPWQTCSIEDHLVFSGKHSAMWQFREDCLYTNIHHCL